MKYPDQPQTVTPPWTCCNQLPWRSSQTPLSLIEKEGGRKKKKKKKGKFPSNRGRFYFPYQQPFFCSRACGCTTGGSSSSVLRSGTVHESLLACGSRGLVQGPPGSPQGYRLRGTLDGQTAVVESSLESSREASQPVGSVAKPDGGRDGPCWTLTEGAAGHRSSSEQGAILGSVLPDPRLLPNFCDRRHGLPSRCAFGPIENPSMGRPLLGGDRLRESFAAAIIFRAT